MVSKTQIEYATELAVRNSFFRYFFSRDPVETKHILLSRLYPNESVTGSAIVGLQTSLGTTLWENLAQISRPACRVVPVTIAMHCSPAQYFFDA